MVSNELKRFFTDDFMRNCSKLKSFEDFLISSDITHQSTHVEL